MNQTCLLYTAGMSAEQTSYIVFSFGSGEAGQLGNGTTGERISPGKTAFDVISSPSECIDNKQYFV